MPLDLRDLEIDMCCMHGEIQGLIIHGMVHHCYFYAQTNTCTYAVRSNGHQKLEATAQ